MSNRSQRRWRGWLHSCEGRASTSQGGRRSCAVWKCVYEVDRCCALLCLSYRIDDTKRSQPQRIPKQNRT